MKPPGALRVLALVVLLFVAGCKVSGEVTIEVDDDGSGTVTVAVSLDDEAQARVGDLATELKLDDLTQSGWTITPPRHTNGEWVVSGSKPFGSPEGLQQVLDEVGGADGVFRGWTIELESGFGSTEWTVRGQVVLSGTLDQFGDAELTQTLDGLALGRTPEELAAELGDGGTFPIELEVRMPADIDQATGSGDDPVVDGSSATWTYAVPGDAVEDQLSIRASESDSDVYRWFLLAGLLVVLAAIVMVLGSMRRRSRPLNRPG